MSDANVVALSGAIIEEVRGSVMRYYSRCNHCMDVPNSTTTSSVPNVNSILTGNYRCGKCRKDTKIQIKRIS